MRRYLNALIAVVLISFFTHSAQASPFQSVSKQAGKGLFRRILKPTLGVTSGYFLYKHYDKDPILIFDDHISDLVDKGVFPFSHGEVVQNVIQADLSKIIGEFEGDNIDPVDLSPLKPREFDLTLSIFPALLTQGKFIRTNFLEPLCAKILGQFDQKLNLDQRELIQSLFDSQCKYRSSVPAFLSALILIDEFENFLNHETKEFFLRLQLERIRGIHPRVINFSLAFNDVQPSRILYSFIQSHPEIIFVKAAGNQPIDLNASPYSMGGVWRSYVQNAQYTDYTQALCTLPNVICVAATDESDRDESSRDATLAEYSTRGAPVAVAAPGTVRYKGIVEFQGTSFAAPIVTRTIGYMLRVNPSLTSDEIIAILKETTRISSNPDLRTKTAWGGVIGQRAAIERAAELLGPEYRAQSSVIKLLRDFQEFE